MVMPLNLLPDIVFSADVATRNDASLGLIANERDYMSTWLTTSRNLWRILGGTSSLMTLPDDIERKIGADILICVRGPLHSKYLFIEAKRYKTKFDSLKNPSPAAVANFGIPTAPKISRFTDQIVRQAAHLAIHPNHVIYEMFLHMENTVPPLPYQQFGSTLVSHSTVRNVFPPVGARSPYNVWNMGDVTPLVGMNPSLSIKEILSEVIACNLGNPYSNYELPFGLLNPIYNFEEARQILYALGIRHFVSFDGMFPWEPEDYDRRIGNDRPPIDGRLE